MSTLLAHVGDGLVAVGWRGRDGVVPAAAHGGPGGPWYGPDAVGQAGSAPEWFEPDVFEYLGEDFLVLGVAGARPHPVPEVVAALLRRAAQEVGCPPQVGLLVLTHPTGWGGVRRRALHAAASALAAEVVLVPRAAAAARGLAELGTVGGAVIVVEQGRLAGTAALVRVAADTAVPRVVGLGPGAGTGAALARSAARVLPPEGEVDIVVVGAPAHSPQDLSGQDPLAPDPLAQDQVEVLPFDDGRRAVVLRLAGWHRHAARGAEAAAGAHGLEAAQGWSAQGWSAQAPGAPWWPR